MTSIRITTWNVLHRIHAVNWGEEPRLLFPDERVRIAGISKLIASEMDAGASTVVCLQEVSGDQLASLREVAKSREASDALAITIFSHCYPRVPKLRADGPSELDDRTEHLVTLVARSTVSSIGAKHVGAETFARDPGKGHLAIELGEPGKLGKLGKSSVLLINTHVTYGKLRDVQIQAIATKARAYAGTVIIVGDFNTEMAEVQALLGEGFVVSNLASSGIHTRITAPSANKPSRTIDHVAVLRGSIDAASVRDVAGLSDHNPVSATVGW